MFTQTATTPTLHVAVDDPHNELDLALVDEKLQRTLSCIQNIAQTGFTDEEFTKGECWTRQIDTDFRECLEIKVAPDWTYNCSGTEQVFPCNIGDQRCLEKGQTPTPECPCRCRGVIQDNMIVVTPNLRLLNATFTTMLTGCLSPWVGRLAECSR